MVILLIIVSAIGAQMGGSTKTGSNSTPTTAPTSAPTSKPTTAPTAAPAPVVQAPIVVSGSGSKITDPFTLPVGKYRMSWTAQGHDNFIVTLHYPTGQSSLINQIPPQPASGQAYVESGGGSHFLEVQAATLNWSMTFASLAGDQLNAATPPAPLTGSGSVVTTPINLPTGSYRLTWSAQGHDNFIVNLHWSDGQSNLINQIPPDPASGEALVTSGGGRHFLEIEGATLTWTITFTKL